MKIAMIGLGRMGANMVRRLLRAKTRSLRSGASWSRSSATRALYEYDEGTWGPAEAERLTQWAVPGLIGKP